MSLTNTLQEQNVKFSQPSNQPVLLPAARIIIIVAMPTVHLLPERAHIEMKIRPAF